MNDKMVEKCAGSVPPGAENRYKKEGRMSGCHKTVSETEAVMMLYTVRIQQKIREIPPVLLIFGRVEKSQNKH